MVTLTQRIKNVGYELGFSHVGVCNVDVFQEQYEALTQRKGMYQFFIDRRYMLQACDPKNIMKEAKAIIGLIFDFSLYDYPKNLIEHVGRVYLARGYTPLKDTQSWLRIQRFKDFLTENNIHFVEQKMYWPERSVAARAGIATFGHNNFVYAHGGSSFVQLYSFIVDVPLEFDSPTLEVRCPPNCRKCIDGCPTKALYAPGKLNPQLCIAYNNYMTQDNMHPLVSNKIPYELRPLIGQKIYGCDVCQEVCPRNQGALKQARIKDPFIEQIASKFSLDRILLMDDRYYQDIINPIMFNYIRDPKYIKRNAAIAMGNSKNHAFIPSLIQALQDVEPIVREYAAWALWQLDPIQAKSIFASHLNHETTQNVKDEITHLLNL